MDTPVSDVHSTNPEIFAALPSLDVFTPIMKLLIQREALHDLHVLTGLAMHEGPQRSAGCPIH